MRDYNVDATSRFPIKAWTKGVSVEDVAVEQLRNLANMPFIHKHVVVLPDCHWGMGGPIGSVFATKDAIISDRKPYLMLFDSCERRLAVKPDPKRQQF